jgi:hypothetical protein
VIPYSVSMPNNFMFLLKCEIVSPSARNDTLFCHCEVNIVNRSDLKVDLGLAPQSFIK